MAKRSRRQWTAAEARKLAMEYGERKRDGRPISEMLDRERLAGSVLYRFVRQYGSEPPTKPTARAALAAPPPPPPPPAPQEQPVEWFLSRLDGEHEIIERITTKHDALLRYLQLTASGDLRERVRLYRAIEVQVTVEAKIKGDPDAH